jgi:hypothetical protein
MIEEQYDFSAYAFRAFFDIGKKQAARINQWQ